MVFKPSCLSLFSYDSLEVRDGDNASANLIGSKLCGSTVPATIVSTGNALFVRFKSDHSVVGKGYKIKVTAGKLSRK